jgi:hypothetical protein
VVVRQVRVDPLYSFSRGPGTIVTLATADDPDLVLASELIGMKGRKGKGRIRQTTTYVLVVEEVEMGDIMV